MKKLPCEGGWKRERGEGGGLHHPESFETIPGKKSPWLRETLPAMLVMVDHIPILS